MYTRTAEARSQFTRLFEARLIDTLKECDVTGVTRLSGTSWDETWGVLMRAVTRGLARKEKLVPARIGIDEKSIGKGHNYESIVCDLDKGTVEYVVDDREQKSLESHYGSSPKMNWLKTRELPWTCGILTSLRQRPMFLMLMKRSYLTDTTQRRT